MGISDSSRLGFQSDFKEQLSANTSYQSSIKEESAASQTKSYVESNKMDINQQKLDEFMGFLASSDHAGLRYHQATQLVAQANEGEFHAKRELAGYLQDFAQYEVETLHQGFSGDDLTHANIGGIRGAMDDISQTGLSGVATLAYKGETATHARHTDNHTSIKNVDKLDEQQIRQNLEGTTASGWVDCRSNRQ